MQQSPSAQSDASGDKATKIGLGFGEFVFVAAMMTGIGAISIDVMLPVLPKMSVFYGLENPNDAQLIIGVFFLGFGLSQIVFGSLADTFGRRKVLIYGLCFFTVTTLAAAWTTNFTALLICRFAAGIGVSAVRITTLAIVRDCFGGRRMAQVMSYVTFVFMVVPIVAPSLGQLIDSYSNWHWIFILMGASGAGLLVWSLLRLNESLSEKDRRPLSVQSVLSGFGIVLSNRVTAGYMFAMTFFAAVICAYIVSVQQLFGDVYGMGDKLPLAFAFSSAGMAVASLLNGSFVRRFGMRRISHAGAIAFTLIAIGVFLLALGGKPPFLITYAALCILLMLFAVLMNNFTAISLEPMGHLAGTATSVTGFVSMSLGAIIGGSVGQMFDGTIRPLFAGFALFGIMSILSVLWAEKGRLFTHPGDLPGNTDGGAAGHM